MTGTAAAISLAELSGESDLGVCCDLDFGLDIGSSVQRHHYFKV
jgi:hypothetical protein